MTVTFTVELVGVRPEDGRAFGSVWMAGLEGFSGVWQRRPDVPEEWDRFIVTKFTAVPERGILRCIEYELDETWNPVGIVSESQEFTARDGAYYYLNPRTGYLSETPPPTWLERNWKTVALVVFGALGVGYMATRR